MDTKIKNEIIAICEANPTVESCGFISFDGFGGKTVHCKNVSATPSESFSISPEDYVNTKVLGSILAVWHSHIGDTGFSPHDLEKATEVAVPIYMYNLVTKSWSEFIPKTYCLPFEGRQFAWGFQDCYSLVRDYYRVKFGIYLNDYDRDESFTTLPSQDILELYTKEGGYKAVGTTQIKLHDVLVFSVANILPQHFGVFVGNSRILHHTHKGLSRTDLFNAGWQRRLKAVLRHSSNP